MGAMSAGAVILLLGIVFLVLGIVIWPLLILAGIFGLLGIIAIILGAIGKGASETHKLATTYRCPFCDSRISKSAKVCPVCRKNLTEIGSEIEEHPNRLPTLRYEGKCPYCDAKIPKGQEVYRYDHELVQCPNCKELNRIDEMKVSKRIPAKPKKKKASVKKITKKDEKDEALEILRLRYAKGEITKDQYLESKKILEET